MLHTGPARLSRDDSTRRRFNPRRLRLALPTFREANPLLAYHVGESDEEVAYEARPPSLNTATQLCTMVTWPEGG